jgi:hypothetical protein
MKLPRDLSGADLAPALGAGSSPRGERGCERFPPV